MEVLALGMLFFSGGLATFFVTINFKKIITRIEGKRIAVLGASTAGKTTLFLYLEMLPMKSTEIRATRTIENTGIGEIKISSGNKYISFRFRETKDVPGDVENRNSYWKGLVTESDIVLYLINTYELLKGENQKETKERIKEDLMFINEWVNNDPKKVIIIGNHYDKIDESFTYNQDKLKEHEDKFKKNEIFLECGKGMEKKIATFKDKDGVIKALTEVSKLIAANR